MADNNIQQRVIDIVASELGVDKDKVKPESKFIDDLGADSLNIAELVMRMEDEFQMEIPDEEAENIRTVQDAIDYIEKHLS